jgi:hypothetical protein
MSKTLKSPFVTTKYRTHQINLPYSMWKLKRFPLVYLCPLPVATQRASTIPPSTANALEVLFLPTTTLQMWQNYSEILHSAFHQTQYTTVNTRKTQDKFGSTCDVSQYVTGRDKTKCQMRLYTSLVSNNNTSCFSTDISTHNVYTVYVIWLPVVYVSNLCLTLHSLYT